MIEFDLEAPINFGHNTFTDSLKGPANVHRTNRDLQTDVLKLDSSAFVN